MQYSNINMLATIFNIHAHYTDIFVGVSVTVVVVVVVKSD